MKNPRLGALIFLAVSIIALLVLRMLPDTPRASGKMVAGAADKAEAADRVAERETPIMVKRELREKAATTIRMDADGGTAHVALDEVAVTDGDGKQVIVKLDPPATYKTLSARMLEFGDVSKARPVAYMEGVEKNSSSRRIVTSDIRARISREKAKEVARQHGLVIKEMPEYAPEWVVFSAENPLDALEKIEEVREDDSVDAADVLLAVLHSKKAAPNDPLYSDQWHLKTSGTAVAGTDVNIEDVWKYGATGGTRGVGVRIGIVDDGLQTAHPDLASNVDTANDYDWNGRDNDPNPGTGDDHGTSCAGNAGAAGNNSRGVIGTAPESRLVGMRLIAAEVTDLQESEAMAYLPQLVQIKSNSWGPDDDGRSLSAPGPMTQAAFANSAATGRDGKGSIFVWAGGNGGATATRDNSNYDGYANSIYTIAIGATDSRARRADYAEPGANLVVCAPSSGSGSLGITTVDRTGREGYNTASGDAGNYTDDFGGTSSATPTAAGIIALLLEKNPDLGWRDVQEILIRSARKIAPTDADWQDNGAGFHFNHNFGAGLIDAQAAVGLATGWTNLGSQASVVSTQSGISASIPNNSATGVTRTFSIPSSNLRVEQTTLRLSITHAARGELEISLTSPSGTVSRLAETRNDRNANYSDWTFSSVRNWGELSSGTWTLKIADRSGTNGSVGTLTAAELKVFGTAAAPVNPAPVVTITSPFEGSVSSPGVPLTVRVDASDFDVSGNASPVTKVDLFRDGTLVGTRTSTPYDFVLTPPVGTNVYIARATDQQGQTGSSAGRTTVVRNQAPEIGEVTLNFAGQAFADVSLAVLSVTTTDPENDSLILSYQWQTSIDAVNYRDLPGANSAALPVDPSNAGKIWRCRVSATDGTTSVSAFSPPVNILERPAAFVSRNGAYEYRSGLVLPGVETEIDRQAIIHEFSQGPSGSSSEWIEILVLQTGSLRFWDFKDDAGNTVVFKDTAVWDDVTAGTLIVVYNGSTAKDPILPADVFDKANGRIVVSSSNDTYFDSSFDTWPPLGNSGDSIFLSDADNELVHQIAYGNSTAASPNIGSVGSGTAAYYNGSSDAGADDGAQWRTTKSNVARAFPARSISPAAVFTNGSYTQNFNTVPGQAGTSYPTGWTSYNLSGGAILNDDVMSDGTQGPGTGANYNFGSKIGLLGSGSAFDPGSLVLALANTSGLSGLRVGFNVSKVTEAPREMRLTLQYATADPASAGTGWTAIAGFTYLSGSSPVGTVTPFPSIALPAVFDNRPSPVYLRWFYETSSGSGGRDAIAIDDVTITSATSGGAALALSLNPSTVQENAGTSASTGTVTLPANATAPLSVQLASSDSAVASVPTVVTIAAGSSSASFTIAAIDNNTGEGTRTVSITASASGYTPSSATLTVLDDEAPLIGVTPAKPNGPENGTFVTALKNNTLNSSPVFRLAQGTVLPSGLLFDPATGRISGTVAANAPLGDFPVTIELTNSNGELVSQTFVVNVRAASLTFASWIAGFDVADRTSGGDSDLDGLPNLLEYALGLRPDVRDSSAVIFSRNGEAVSITYTTDNTVTDAVVTAEWSPTLASGSWIATDITVSTLSDVTASRTLKASLPVDPAFPKRFLRLRAEAP